MPSQHSQEESYNLRDEISQWIWNLPSKSQMNWEISSIFVGFFENLNSNNMNASIFYSWCIVVQYSRPVNLHPLFLKIGCPVFWKLGTLFFFKSRLKNRVTSYSKREDTRLPLLFLNYNDLGFLHSVSFKKLGARFLRIVDADWLGDCLTELFPIYQINIGPSDGGKIVPSTHHGGCCL